MLVMCTGYPPPNWGRLAGVVNGVNAVLERLGYGMLPRNTLGPLGNRRSTFVNLTLDPEKRITGFYAGDVAQAHDAGWTAAETETAIRVN